FAWNFGGGAPNVTVQNPGAVAFATQGMFSVTFTCRDALGAADPTPPMRPVRAAERRVGKGTIAAPTTDVTIGIGQTVDFQGSCTDPENNTPFTFAWDFGGGAPNITVQNPGTVTFATQGTFTVTFTCRDALGAADPTPDVRLV